MIPVKWLADFYNHMRALEGEKSLKVACLIASGITNALKNGKTGLAPLDSFPEIDISDIPEISCRIVHPIAKVILVSRNRSLMTMEMSSIS